MTSERELFLGAMQLDDVEARRVHVRESCGHDSELRVRVEALLEVYENAGNFLEAPAAIVWSAPAAPPEETGTVIGPYRLLEPIGEGGMGTVYMAEQTQPVRRLVALKVIKAGMDTRQVLARFEAERQALALMDHPNIARVLDAGTTSAGRPFFVMELVQGVPITDYCDERRLTPRERLELFIPVCQAVQHAHQKGVIHRDLKPSNVLVGLYDGQPVPKVIDFGVAKAAGPRLTEATLFTVYGALVGTPEYMSPEQAQFDNLDVDTRSDVYSLGVLLYELLTGTTPLDRARQKEAAILEVLRVVREEEPPRPSTRLSTSEKLPGVAACRNIEPRKLCRLVRGELDWIVMRALEKNRSRRYETANGLAADVKRYLADEPVEACPPSALYRLGKFSRRHQVVLTTSGLVALVLVAGAVASAWQAARARRASDESARRSEEARKVVQYLVDDVFGAGGPARAGGRMPTVVDMLESADATVARSFARQPLVEASVRMALGRAYENLAEYDKEAEQYERAAALRLRYLGPDHPDTLAARTSCLAQMAQRGQKDEMIALGRSIFVARRRLLGPGHPDTIYALAHLGYLMGRWDEHRDEAIRLGTEAFHTAQHALGPDHPLTWETLDVLGVNINRRGDLERAEVLLRQAVAGYDRTGGASNPSTYWGYKHLCRVVERRGRITEAREVAARSLERITQVYGVAHGETRDLLSDVARLLYLERNATGLRDFSEAWIRRVHDAPGEPNHWALGCRAAMLDTLALALAARSEAAPYDLELALRAAEQSVTLDSQRRLGWTTLGIVRFRLGRLEAAQEALRHAEPLAPGKEGDALLRFGEALTCFSLGYRTASWQAFDRAVAAQAEWERSANRFDLHLVILRELRGEISNHLGLEVTAAPAHVVGPPGAAR